MRSSLGVRSLVLLQRIEGKDESRRNSEDGSLFGLEEHAHDVLGFREANLGVQEHFVHGGYTHALEQVGSSASDDGTFFVQIIFIE